jgi:hypothetical protein
MQHTNFVFSFFALASKFNWPQQKKTIPGEEEQDHETGQGELLIEQFLGLHCSIFSQFLGLPANKQCC